MTESITFKRFEEVLNEQIKAAEVIQRQIRTDYRELLHKHSRERREFIEQAIPDLDDTTLAQLREDFPTFYLPSHRHRWWSSKYRLNLDVTVEKARALLTIHLEENQRAKAPIEWHLLVAEQEEVEAEWPPKIARLVGEICQLIIKRNTIHHLNQGGFAKLPAPIKANGIKVVVVELEQRRQEASAAKHKGFWDWFLEEVAKDNPDVIVNVSSGAEVIEPKQR